MGAPILTPHSIAEIQDAIADAARGGGTLQIQGGGSKADMSVPNREGTVLSMAGFSDVVEYDAPELVLTVGAGMSLARVQALIEERRQMLAFEPFDHGPIFGCAAGAATIGGVIGAGVSGSRRLSAGAARDHVLGFEAVSGRGERFIAGGRVVKNVTGYDLPKLMTGSWGQLAVLTQVTLKVLPMPREIATIALFGLNDDRAVSAMCAALRSQAEVAAAAHVVRWALPGVIEAKEADGASASRVGTAPISGQPPSAHGDARTHRAAATPRPIGGAARREQEHTLPGGASLTGFRLEGFGPSVTARAGMLRGLLAEFGEAVILSEGEAAAFWGSVRDVSPLAEGRRPLWRVNVPATEAPRVTASLRDHDARWYYDWGGSLIWLTLPATADCALVRNAAAKAGGHAALVRADAAMRSVAPLLHPESPAVAALAKRIKAGFDPANVLDPHRFTTARDAN